MKPFFIIAGVLFLLTMEEKMSTYKKPEADKLKSCLTKLQYNVTQKGETEQPFNNEYWDNKEEGIYVDVVSGEPLFSSSDKYDSGSGWPSFTRPLVKENLVEKSDNSISHMERTELRSKHGDSHLGHVFDDGPMPTGKRFCINSASLRFVPKENLEKEGYGQFNNLFTERKVTKGDTETIYLAGGCFWGMEELLRKMEGMVEVEVGYAGGITKNPTYEEVKTGGTGHAESVKLVFNPNHLSLEELLLFFFRIHDPTTQNRQGNDIGSQYRSAIFYVSEEQKEAAVRIMKDPRVTERWKKPLVTELTAFNGFYPAESYHQDYLQKHPDGYTCHYLRP